VRLWRVGSLHLSPYTISYQFLQVFTTHRWPTARAGWLPAVPGLPKGEGTESSRLATSATEREYEYGVERRHVTASH
jgi:hypothetical protein